MYSTEISHDVLLICCHEQLHCFFASIYGKWFPWEFTDGHMLLRGKPPWLAHWVCGALHGIGLWDLQS